MDFDQSQFKISLTHIVKLLGETQRPFIEGEKVFEADHIVICGVKDRSPESIQILAACQQSSNLAQIHEINITINIKGGTKKIKCHCSCKAGEGNKCKHIFATLIYINRKYIDNLDVISCTELKQQWGKIKSTKKFSEDQVVSIDKFCCYKPSYKTEFIPDQALNDLLRDNLLKGLPDSEAAIHFSQERGTASESVANEQHDMECQIHLLDRALMHAILNVPLPFSIQELPEFPNQELYDFYIDNVFVNEERAMKIFLSTKTQNNHIWKEERKTRITGSVCYQLLTYSRNRKANWETKVKQIYFKDFAGNADTRHGVLNEDKARELYVEMMGVNIEKLGLVIQPRIPWLGYSADGLITKYNCLIEIKCPKRGREISAHHIARELPYILINNKGTYLKENHSYYGQVQLGMFLLNLSVCHFLIYCTYDDSLLTIPVPFNRLWANSMVESLRVAYFQHILPEMKKLYDKK